MENKEQTKTYIELVINLLRPESFKIANRDLLSLRQVAEKFPDLATRRHPLGHLEGFKIFGYRFFDRQEYIAQNGEVLSGEIRDTSPLYIFGERVTEDMFIKRLQQEMQKGRGDFSRYLPGKELEKRFDSALDDFKKLHPQSTFNLWTNQFEIFYPDSIPLPKDLWKDYP
jgi:hypothetical protein